MSEDRRLLGEERAHALAAIGRGQYPFAQSQRCRDRLILRHIEGRIDGLGPPRTASPEDVLLDMMGAMFVQILIASFSGNSTQPSALSNHPNGT